MPEAVKPRGEYAKTARRRQEILDAGLQVFSAGGYRSGSIRDIADRVGLSQAGLLHHFASKSELLEAVLTHRDAQARERLASGSQLQGLDLLRAFLALVEFNASTPGLVGLYCVLAAEATTPDHPAHEYFQQRYAGVLQSLTTAFEDIRRAGQLTDAIEPAEAARMVTAATDGLQIQWLLRPDDIDMAAFMRHYVQSLLTVPL